MPKTDKQQGTCSVCLRMMQLSGDRPIRHGFSAVGVRHGQSGGYHTGPCAGTQFPHLGISTEGTTWALDRERAFLKRTLTALATHATNPDITWHPTKYDVRGGRPDFANPGVVKYGDEAPIAMRSGDAPSYASLHRAEKVKLDNQQHVAERAIAAYEAVLASWSPEKYPTTGAPTKTETVHMERPITLRGQTIVGVLCKGLRAMRGQRLLKTDDPAKVTCKRCRVALGLPAL